MPRRVPTIRIVPEVLAWARESAGLSQDELGRKLRSGEANISDWERPGTVTLVTPGQLESIADAIKRPAAALLLESPPEEPRPPKDFRRPNRRPDRHSPGVSRAIRRARRLQRIAVEVFPTLEEHKEPDLPATFTVTDDGHRAAVQVRNALDIPRDIHTQWKDVSTALRTWRAFVESRNILVFSADFPRDEAQGFSLSDAEPNVVMLSAKDPPTARSFTLWHEFGHLLLRDTGLCITDEPEEPNPLPDRKTEDWCNRFAEAMLVDSDLLQAHEQVSAVVSRRPGYESDLSDLARHFKVSQHVALFRMRHLGMLPEGTFWEEFHRVRNKQKETARERRRGSAPDPANIAVRDSGQWLARALLQAFDRGSLTHAELADYFGTRLKHLENIRREAYR